MNKQQIIDFLMDDLKSGEPEDLIYISESKILAQYQSMSEEQLHGILDMVTSQNEQDMVEYIEEREVFEKSFEPNVGKEYKLKNDETTVYTVLGIVDNNALIQRTIADKSISDPTPFIVAMLPEIDKNGFLSWASGSYSAEMPTDFKLPVYLGELSQAIEKGEKKIFCASQTLNYECVKTIDTAIEAGKHDSYFYNLTDALNEVTEKFGAERVNAVLANTVKFYNYDGRLSRQNKDWAQKINTPDDKYLLLKTHLAVLDGFVDYSRKAWEKAVIGTPEDEITVSTQAELDKISLNYEGKILINGGTFDTPITVANTYKNEVTATKNSFVELQNNAKVTAKDRAKIFAYDDSVVTAKNGFTLPPVEAHGRSTIYANDSVSVYAYNESTVNAFHDSEVVAYDNAKVIANDRAGIIAYNNSTIEVMSKDVMVNASDNVKVDVMVNGEPKIMLSGNAVVRKSIKEQAQKRSIRQKLKEPLPKSTEDKSLQKSKTRGDVEL